MGKEHPESGTPKQRTARAAWACRKLRFIRYTDGTNVRAGDDGVRDEHGGTRFGAEPQPPLAFDVPHDSIPPWSRRSFNGRAERHRFARVHRSREVGTQPLPAQYPV